MDVEVAIKTARQKRSDIKNIDNSIYNYKNTKYMLLKILFTISGFVAAILINILFPQKADVEFKTYTLNLLNLKIGFNMNSAYIVVLIALILIYGTSGIISLFQKDRRKLYAKNAAFRFFLGIALAIWDIGGTKLQIFAQPFFPGPAQIIEAYIADGSYIVQNTLYSIRLYAAGFSCGVLLGVGTGILIGWFPKVYYWVFPVLKITGVVPAVAWMPFALMLPMEKCVSPLKPSQGYTVPSGFTDRISRAAPHG